jgi:hypothetical protein
MPSELAMLMNVLAMANGLQALADLKPLRQSCTLYGII